MEVKTDGELGTRHSLCDCCVLFLNQHFRWHDQFLKCLLLSRDKARHSAIVKIFDYTGNGFEKSLSETTTANMHKY